MLTNSLSRLIIAPSDQQRSILPSASTHGVVNTIQTPAPDLPYAGEENAANPAATFAILGFLLVLCLSHLYLTWSNPLTKRKLQSPSKISVFHGKRRLASLGYNRIALGFTVKVLIPAAIYGLITAQSILYTWSGIVSAAVYLLYQLYLVVRDLVVHEKRSLARYLKFHRSVTRALAVLMFALFRRYVSLILLLACLSFGLQRLRLVDFYGHEETTGNLIVDHISSSFANLTTFGYDPLIYKNAGAATFAMVRGLMTMVFLVIFLALITAEILTLQRRASRKATLQLTDSGDGGSSEVKVSDSVYAQQELKLSLERLFASRFQ